MRPARLGAGTDTLVEDCSHSLLRRGSHTAHCSSAVFHDQTDTPLIVQRLREVGASIQEQITARNHSLKPARCVIALTINADFADLFEV